MKNRGTSHSLNRRPSWVAQRAFTIIELVSVMILIGVMAAVALPRFADNGLFASAGFTSELTAALKHARKSAVAMRRNVCVCVGVCGGVAANALTFTRSIDPAAAAFACVATTLPLPGQSSNVLAAPSGVGVAAVPTSVAFNGLGQPSATATFTVTASDGSTSSVVVEAGSGYVH